MKRPLNQSNLAAIITDLWRKQNDFMREAAYCRNHNYMIEAQVLDKQADVLKQAIFEIETLLD